LADCCDHNDVVVAGIKRQSGNSTLIANVPRRD